MPKRRKHNRLCETASQYRSRLVFTRPVPFLLTLPLLFLLVLLHPAGALRIAKWPRKRGRRAQHTASGLYRSSAIFRFQQRTVAAQSATASTTVPCRPSTVAVLAAEVLRPTEAAGVPSAAGQVSVALAMTRA